ncbi:MAG: hypothetical protein JXR97_16510 [Planctomycetes bacterium]|nr:hypothetical protein [Planctomycetota bacterium]
MKRIVVTRLDGGFAEGELERVGRELDRLEHHKLDVLNWPEFSYAPTVSFSVGHDGDSLFIKYRVMEKTMLALCGESNQPVCTDSCVEFFFSTDDGEYVNFEFNCIGTALVGQGACREGRVLFTPASIRRIRRISTLGTEPFAEKAALDSWELLAAIPLELAGLPRGIPAGGMVCRGNFYKCGDALSTPHYLSWNPVVSAAPDFHRPECFGEIVFE